MEGSLSRLLEKEGWEVKTMEEIADRIDSGCGIKKDQLRDSGYPAIRYGEIHSANLFIHRCTNFTDPSLIQRKKYCEFGDLLMAKVSEDVENAGKAVAFLGEKAMIGEAVFCVKHGHNPKFMPLILGSEFCRAQVRRLLPHGTVMNFTKSHLNQIRVPLPPRHVQDLLGDFLYELTQTVSRLSEKLKRENGDLGSIETRYLRAGS